MEGTQKTEYMTRMVDICPALPQLEASPMHTENVPAVSPKDYYQRDFFMPLKGIF